MNLQQWLECVSHELRKRNLPSHYSARLLEELAEHFTDIQLENQGMDAQKSVEERMGSPEQLAIVASAEFRRSSFVNAVINRFFHGWRKKLGIVTLLLAFALTGVWIRGTAIQDSIWFGSAIQESSFSAEVQKVVTRGRISDTLSSSAIDGFVWGRWRSGEGNLSWIPGWKTYSTGNNDFLDPFEPGGVALNPELKIYRRCQFGFEIGNYQVWKGKEDTYSFWRVSHWSVVLLLSALSIVLILSGRGWGHRINLGRPRL